MSEILEKSRAPAMKFHCAAQKKLKSRKPEIVGRVGSKNYLKKKSKK